MSNISGEQFEQGGTGPTTPVTQGTVPWVISGTVTGPLTDAQLRATPVPISGSVTTGDLTDAQLRATPVPVSGTVVTGGLTDTQLRATPVPVSGTVTTSGLTDTQLRATPVPVSGTVTATGPLTDTQLRATPVPVSGTVTATPPYSLGQKTMANSVPVTVASDQSAIPILESIGTAATAAWTSATANGTTLVAAVTGYSAVRVTQNASSLSNGICAFEASDDGGTTYYAVTGAVTSQAGSTYTFNTGSNFGLGNTGSCAIWFEVAGFTHFRIRLTTVISSGTSNLRITPCLLPWFPGVSLISNNAGNITVNEAQVGGTTITLTTLAIQASQVSAVTNTTTTRTTTTGLGIYSTLDILLSITGAGVATGNLQIYIEDSVDGGTTWDDLVSFNVYAFAAGATTQRAVVQGAIATTRTQCAAQAIETLAAGTVRQGPFGDRIRVREKVSGVSGSPTGATYVINAIGKISG